jgi:hypothetical protein
MAMVQLPARRLVFVAAAAVVLVLAPMVAVFAGPIVDPATHAIAQDECGGSDTTDDYTLTCVPNVVPDVSDQLTEEEVASPGFNASPGGGGGGSAGGGGGGHR